MDYVPDQPLSPPERDRELERIEREEYLADQRRDEAWENEPCATTAD